jgi:hypothetical protein
MKRNNYALPAFTVAAKRLVTPVLVCIGIAFSPYIVGVVCITHVLLSETGNNEGIEKIFNKILWRVNDNFLNAIHKMLLLTVD